MALRMRFIVGTLLLIPQAWSLPLDEIVAAPEKEEVESEDGVVVDDRTLLDIFGEGAKDYLTQQVIPATDAECQWDWRNVRCEPNCECGLEFKLGDFHLGRTCRQRTKTAAPLQCDTPRSTAKIFDATIEKARILGAQVMTQAIVLGMKTKEKVELARELACLEVPRECLPEDDTPPRTLREKVLCGHIHPCDDEAQLHAEIPDKLSFPENAKPAPKFGDSLPGIGEWAAP